MKEQERAEVLDVGLLDHVVRHRSWTVRNDRIEEEREFIRSQSQQYPLPEGLMSKLKTHIGDGNAKVTVGCELAHSKEFGCKAQAFVSVSVTCGNNEEDIQAVHNIVQPLARSLVNEDLEVMKQDRDAHLSGGRVSTPPQTRIQPSSNRADPLPRANNPTFRR